MKRLILVCCLFFCIPVDVKVSNGQEQEDTDELKTFFKDYSDWQRIKRASGDKSESNAAVNLNWGYQQEETIYWASESKDKRNFHSAFIACKQKGMEPVTVTTLAQNTALKKFLEPRITSDGHQYWLGAQKVGDKDQFYWLNTGQPLIFNKWYVNYPDNVGGNENCLAYLFSGDIGPGWNDNKCDILLRYACQKRRSSVAFILDFNRGIF